MASAVFGLGAVDAVFQQDVVLEDRDVDIPQALRPTFDALWQTLGREGSPNYRADGTWSGKVD